MCTASELIRESGESEGWYIVPKDPIHSPQLNRKFCGFWQSRDIKPMLTLQ